MRNNFEERFPLAVALASWNGVMHLATVMAGAGLIDRAGLDKLHEVMSRPMQIGARDTSGFFAGQQQQLDNLIQAIQAGLLTRG